VNDVKQFVDHFEAPVVPYMSDATKERTIKFLIEAVMKSKSTNNVHTYTVFGDKKMEKKMKQNESPKNYEEKIKFISRMSDMYDTAMNNGYQFFVIY
jgi:hypothetical protein